MNFLLKFCKKNTVNELQRNWETLDEASQHNTIYLIGKLSSVVQGLEIER